MSVDCEQTFTAEQLLDEISMLASEQPRKSIENIILKIKENVNADHVHVREIDWVKKTLVIGEGYVLDRDNSINLSNADLSQFISININKAISGTVFNDKTPKNIENVQVDGEFKNYIKTIRNKRCLKFLKSFRSLITIPLYIMCGNNPKSIGVVNVIRRRCKEAKDYEPTKFNDAEYKRVYLMCGVIALALCKVWQHEAAQWSPETGDGIKDLCKSIINEAIKKTGATTGKVRFVDWQNKYLVPSAIQDNIKFEEYMKRRIGCSIPGFTAYKNMNKRIGSSGSPTPEHTYSPNLVEDDKFRIFLGCIDKNIYSYNAELEILKNLDKDISSYNKDITSCLNLVGSYLNNQTNKESKERQERREYWECYHDCHKLHDEDITTELHNDYMLSDRIKLIDNKLRVDDHRNDELKIISEAIELLRRMVNSINNTYNELIHWKSSLSSLRSEVAVPIMFGNKFFGVLNVLSDKEKWFSETDIALLQIIAGRVASAVINHQNKTFNEVHDIEKELTTTCHFEDLSKKLIDGIINSIYNSREKRVVFPILYVCKPISFDELDRMSFSGDLFEYKRKGAPPEEQRLGDVKIRSDGLGCQAIRKLIKIKNTIQTRNLEAEQVIVVRENVEDPIRGGSEEAQEEGVFTTACLPLYHDNYVYGLLYIHIKTRHFFTKMEVDSLSLFAKKAPVIIKVIQRNECTNYSDFVGDKLYNDAAEINIEDSSLFYDIKRILADHKDSVLGCSLPIATSGIKTIVSSLIKKVGLSEKISTRYHEFADEEGLLYNSNSYRDHFFHPFHSFLIGFIILSKFKSMQIKQPFTYDDEFLKKWMVTALWHDTTYVAEKGPEWLSKFIEKKLRININANQDWKPIVYDIENISYINNLSTFFKHEKQEYIRMWFIKQLTERNDHGVLSGLLLQRESKNWGINNNSFIKDCSLAISLHNYHKSYSGDKKDKLNKNNSLALRIGKLNVRKFPLSFLLAFCDTVQEWGRPSNKTINRSKRDAGNLSKYNGKNKNTENYLYYNGIEVIEENGKVQIDVKCKYEKEHTDEKERKNIIELKHAWEFGNRFDCYFNVEHKL